MSEEQKFAVSVFGAETTQVLMLSELTAFLDRVQEEGKKIEFIYDYDEFKSMYPLSI